MFLGDPVGACRLLCPILPKLRSVSILACRVVAPVGGRGAGSYPEAAGAGSYPEA